MITAGELSERVTIEELEITVDDLGGPVETWVPFAKVWARAVSSKGEEGMEAARVGAKRTVKFKTRWLSGVDPKMRLTWRGDVYDIFEIDESLRRNGELWITATAPVGGG